MLIKDVKIIIEDKVAGTRPMPSDLELSFNVYEALQYIATMTTPRVLLRNTKTDVEEDTFRVLEECAYITVPERPIFDTSNKEYSDVKHLNIDEDLAFAVVYYTLHIIMKGNEPTQVGGNKKTAKETADDLIATYQSNFSRAGAEFYGLL